MPLFVQVIAYNSLDCRKDTDSINGYLTELRAGGAEIKNISHAISGGFHGGAFVEYLITYEAHEPVKIKIK